MISTHDVPHERCQTAVSDRCPSWYTNCPSRGLAPRVRRAETFQGSAQPRLPHQYCQYHGNHMKGPHTDPRIVMSRVPRSIHPGSASLVAAFAGELAMYERAESEDQWGLCRSSWGGPSYQYIVVGLDGFAGSPEARRPDRICHHHMNR